MGVIGGCVEPVVPAKHHGNGAGLSMLEHAEAELDRRERALGLLLASADGANNSKNTTCIRTYYAIIKCNTYINPIFKAGATNATKGSGAGEFGAVSGSSGVCDSTCCCKQTAPQIYTRIY